MAVSEQTPYIEYTANGVTTSFAMGFECEESNHLVVTVNDLDTNVGDWFLDEQNIVFKYAPLVDSIVKIWRSSPLERSTTFKTYDNSFTATSLNIDLDKIWLVMQELNVKNAVSNNKLQMLLDSLISGNINGLPAEIIARIAGDLQSKNLINIESNRAYQAEIALGNQIAHEAQIASQNNLSEKNRAESAENILQLQINSIGVGNKAYKTYAEMDADKVNITAKSKVTVTNDATLANNGDWQWDGVVFTKSSYDPLTQAKEYANLKTNEKYFLSSTLSIDMIRGGSHSYVKSSNLVFDGYVTTAGAFVASSAGYKTTDFIIIDSSQPLVYSIDASNTVAGISFWDENKSFISSLSTNNDTSIKTSLPPLNAKFIRISNNSSVTANCYVYSTFKNVLNQTQESKEYTDVLVDGGILVNIQASNFIYSGYITTAGAFVASSAGYKTTEFVELDRLESLIYLLNSSNTVAGISFWDENKNFLGYVTTNNVATEKSVKPLANTKYIRACSNLTATPISYLTMSTSGIKNDPLLLKTTDLTILESLNLAKSEYIVLDKYVNNAGTISSAVGWKHIKVPVTAGKEYSFGRFAIDTGGYCAFYDSNSVYIAGTVVNFNNASLPKTVIAPAGAAYLLIDIARPANTADQHAQLTVNEGATLIEYVSPIGIISEIQGYKLGGAGEDPDPSPIPENVVVQGDSATLADLVADSITTGALIANLPTSSAGLEVGQAYIDTATAAIKVKL